jgi:hypothetical protein
MKVHFRFTTAAFMAIVLIFSSCAMADVLMKEKFHTDGMTIMGHTQPATDKVHTTWITKDKIRSDQGDTSSIIRFDNDRVVVYMLMHADKSYMEHVVGAEDMQGLSKMAGKAMIKVTPTGESKKIGEWNCKKYIQEMDMGMGPMTSEVWATEDIKMPYYDTYEKLSTTMLSQQPGMKESMEAMQQEAKKIKGVRVLTTTTTTMMKDSKVRSTQELLEVKEGSAPSGIFDVPADYKKQSMPDQMRGRKPPAKQRPQ